MAASDKRMDALRGRITDAFNAVRGVGEGATAGLTTYGAAGAIWALRKSDPEFKGITWDQAVELAREQNQEMTAQSPKASAAGQAAGAILPYSKAAKLGATGAAIASGALGATQAYTQTGNTDSALVGGLLGAAGSGVSSGLAKVLPIAGANVKNLALENAKVIGPISPNILPSSGAVTHGSFANTKEAFMGLLKGIVPSATTGASAATAYALGTGGDPYSAALGGALAGPIALKGRFIGDTAKNLAVIPAEGVRRGGAAALSFAQEQAVKMGQSANLPQQVLKGYVPSVFTQPNKVEPATAFVDEVTRRPPVEEPYDEFAQYRASNKPAVPASAPEEDEFAQYRASNKPAVPEEDEFAQYRR